LKLQNICFDEDTMMVSLIDLGCATEFKYPASIGTQGYMPPECYQPLQLADGTCVYAMFEPGQKWVSQWYTGTYDVWAAAWTMLHFWVKGLPETYMNGGYEKKSQFTPELLETFLRAYVPDDSMRDFFMVRLGYGRMHAWRADQGMLISVAHQHACNRAERGPSLRMHAVGECCNITSYIRLCCRWTKKRTLSLPAQSLMGCAPLVPHIMYYLCVSLTILCVCR
jgi:serine/threonine protein kinase